LPVFFLRELIIDFNKEFYHEPHEHHELLIHILSLFALVRVIRGKKILIICTTRQQNLQSFQSTAD